MSTDAAHQEVAHQDHPVRLVVTDDLQRNRLTVAFRLILVIPHLFVLMLWAIAFYLLGLVSWVVAIFTGRLPAAIHDFQAGFVRYQNRVNAYLYLTADPFPPFGTGGSYPVDVEIAGAEQQSRLTILFRWILAIPAFILASVLIQLAQVLAIVAWFLCLFTGRMSEGMRDLQAFCLRYYAQTWAYGFLVTGRYPSLSPGPAG